MPVDTVLHNSKVFYQGELVEAGVAIEDGKIVRIAKEPNLPDASEKINLKGKLLLPGMIDAHVHLRDQQLSYKETFVTGSIAAVAGGVTSVIDMPNNVPPTNDSKSLEKRMQLAKNSLYANVAFNSGFPKKISEISEIAAVGAKGFKIYLSSTAGGFDVDDDFSLSSRLNEVKKTGLPVFVHAEDKLMINERKKQLEFTGKNDFNDYVSAHCPEAEAKAIKRIIELGIKSKINLHFCHLSSSLGLSQIMLAKNLGYPVTCEVTPHNLFLSSEDYDKFGSISLTDPPLRPRREASILWNSLKCGFIDIVASDHAPHALNEKLSPSIWDVKPGIPGLETTFSLLLNQINNCNLSFSELVRILSEAPAKIFSIKKRGAILPMNWADLVVVDMKQKFKINSSFFRSKADYSPFDGMSVKGKIIRTFVNGRLVFDCGQIVDGPGAGKILT